MVITQPDRPKGRGRSLTENAVKSLSRELSLEIFQPKSLKEPQVEQTLKKIGAHILIVVAYGMIIPKKILEIPRFGGINVHASILPRWRGAAPIERAVMAGDTSTGITIMDMDEGLDTGPVYKTIELDGIDQLSMIEIESKLAQLGADALIDILTEYESHFFNAAARPIVTPQDNSLTTYAHKITAQERIPNWNETAVSISQNVKALANRLPVTVKIDDVLLQLLETQPLTNSKPDSQPGVITDINQKGICIQCGTGKLLVTRLKLNRGQGKAMNISSFLNGYKDLLSIGQKL